MFADGDADLDLAADLLANGKTSRLYRRLVFDERIATDVSASQNSREIAGLFQIVATAAPDRSLAELDRGIIQEIARAIEDGPTGDEVERGRVQAESRFLFRLQTVGGFGGKSDQLNAYNTFLSNPGYFHHDLDRYRRATNTSIQRAVTRYLSGAGHVALSIVPRGRPDLALPDSARVDVS
jgi:zinc protease